MTLRFEDSYVLAEERVASWGFIKKVKKRREGERIITKIATECVLKAKYSEGKWKKGGGGFGKGPAIPLSWLRPQPCSGRKTREFEMQVKTKKGNGDLRIIADPRSLTLIE